MFEEMTSSAITNCASGMTCAQDDDSEGERSPVVSIVIPAYNHAHYIGEALASVFKQTFKDIEVIVINDGSPDNTEQILRHFADTGKIVYVYQENKGQAAARNHGLSIARGKYIAFLDD